MELFTSEIFVNGILPFLLVFVLVFAVLRKSKVLGDNQQIDALVSLAIALILVGTKTPRDYIVGMVPWLAVALVVLLVFGLLYGFVFTPTERNKVMKFPRFLRYWILYGGIIFVLILVLVITGKWSAIADWFTSDSVWQNIVVLAIIGFGLWFILRDPASDFKALPDEE